MKKSTYLIIIAAMLLIGGCNRTDEKFDAIKQYVATQNEIGIYKNNSSLYIFDKTADQYYINTKDNIFRIQNDDATDYIEFELSDAPKLNETVDVVMKVSGYKLVSAAYPSMTVTELKDGVCRLTGGERSGYVGLVIAWE